VDHAVRLQDVGDRDMRDIALASVMVSLPGPASLTMMSSPATVFRRASPSPALMLHQARGGHAAGNHVIVRTFTSVALASGFSRPSTVPGGNLAKASLSERTR